LFFHFPHFTDPMKQIGWKLRPSDNITRTDFVFTVV
jgi:hypothetical protein